MKIARWLAWPALCFSLMLGPVMAAEEPVPEAEGTPPSVMMRTGSARVQTFSTAFSK